MQKFSIGFQKAIGNRLVALRATTSTPAAATSRASRSSTPASSASATRPIRARRPSLLALPARASTRATSTRPSWPRACPPTGSSRSTCSPPPTSRASTAGPPRSRAGSGRSTVVGQLRAGQLEVLGRTADRVLQRQRHRDRPREPVQRREWGPTRLDERHRVVASGVFELPWDFQVAPILQYASAAAVLAQHRLRHRRRRPQHRRPPLRGHRPCRPCSPRAATRPPSGR